MITSELATTSIKIMELKVGLTDLSFAIITTTIFKG
jgi:hypothetical protein